MPRLLRDNSNDRESFFLNRRPIMIADATTYTVSAFNSGKMHILPDLTASITITLPALENGLEFPFMYGGVANDAQNWVITPSTSNGIAKGGVLHCDLNAGAGSDELVAVYPNGSSNAKLTVTTPGAGTEVRLYCDGTSWYWNGTVASDTAPAFADP